VPEAFADELCAIYNHEFALGDIVPGAAARSIGRATDERRFIVTFAGETVIDCPVDAITSGRSVVRPARRRPPATAAAGGPGARRPPVAEALPGLLATFAGASREYLYRHYDSEVQGRTWLRPGEADAVVVRTRRERAPGLAFAVGGNPHWCAADPELGARHAVAAAARKVAVTGARPWALTDCLNFGDAEDPGVMGDLEAAIEGLAAAAAALGGMAAPGEPLPFVSGNVSLYNHAGGSSIPPSPIVMCAGVIEDVIRAVPLVLARLGDALVLVGEPRSTLAGSAFMREFAPGIAAGSPPLDLAREAALQRLAVASARDGGALAAHAVSTGGVLVAVVEMLLAGPPEAGLGAALRVAALGAPAACALFAEDPGIVFAAAPADALRMMRRAAEAGLGAWTIGEVTADSRLAVDAGAESAAWDIAVLRAAGRQPLERLWNEDLDA
jgi:phosphoribosylformylglycinamidine synthase subunit PurL